MPLTARCACGNAQITLNALPHMHGVCHCVNCQQRTGSAFGISAYFLRTDVLEHSGDTKIYAFTHSSGTHDQARHFCARCGTTLYWFLSTKPEWIGVAGGCFAPTSLPPPTYSVSAAHQCPWVSLPTDWPMYP